MKILAIETSCDETAVAICDCSGDLNAPTFKVVESAVHSQIKDHKQYGGVMPSLAKREHAKNFVAVLSKVLGDNKNESEMLNEIDESEIKKILEREDGLADSLIDFLKKTPKPEIELISVTVGPGLEPALWVGISVAKVLSLVWEVPVVGADHMEGHIASALADRESPPLPAVALLISGGHTELVLVKNWGDYEILGETRDDAVGEAYDKVARILGLPYPGGPEISKLTTEARLNPPKEIGEVKLPRPMINSNDLDFSLSGLKTAVLYTVRNKEEITEGFKSALALEFENSVADVLEKKVRSAIETNSPKSLIIGGGVIANGYLRERLSKMASDLSVEILLPQKELTTDNAAMIAASGYFRFLISGPNIPSSLIASGSLRLSDTRLNLD